MTLKTASVLAFERNFDLSDGIFRQKNSDDINAPELPIKITEKTVRGTISNRLKTAVANNPAKLDAEIIKANPQTVDVAMLNADYDTLTAEWTLKILPFSGKPCVCNNLAYQEKVIETVAGYLSNTGIRELAERYATNIVNARWLWRNRIGASEINVKVSNEINGQAETIKFKNVKQYSLNEFNIKNDDFTKLVDWIELGLEDNDEFVLLTIEAEAIIGKGQEVYPSQEMNLDRGKGDKSKVLYEKEGFAALHSQKIGNALRTIDNWYENADFPVAIEPYASVTTLGTAFRQPKEKRDFYTLFDNWIIKGTAPSLEDQHYVIAVLIRGGVFGESGKE